MIVYQRNINFKLLLVRILFLVLAISVLKAFELGWEKFTYFSVIIFLCAALISITDFSIYHDRIEVLRWYCFGLIPVKWTTGNTVEGRLETYRMYDEITFDNHNGGLSF